MSKEVFRLSNTEKITINMNVVDLGHVDLLVEQGFYSNRTEFIKAAIRSQLTMHTDVLKETITRKTMVVGILSYNRKELAVELKDKSMLDIKVVGMLRLADDIPIELALQTIKSIKVFGVLRANQHLKEALQSRIHTN